MVVNLHDAKAQLEADGLHVSWNNAQSLWIAASVRDRGEGIRASDDACALLWNSGRWVAVFPAQGLFTYEVPGSLPELVALITAVYAHYQRVGGPFKNAFTQVVSEPDQYLLGRAPAGV